MFYFLKRKYNVGIYQGNMTKKNYFEGWYFKLVSKDGLHTFAVIPGISFNDGDSHCFIQIIDGIRNKTLYIRYPLHFLKFSKDYFNIQIGNSIFTKDYIFLDINQENFSLHGTLYFNNVINYPSSFLSPGVMGWYGLIPTMECYHGVISINHTIKGTLNYNNNILNFSDGKGYIEKDWGKSFPSSWIWIQSNNFSNENTSFMVSIANIPWLGRHFIGFLCYLYYNNSIITFATYNGSKIKKVQTLNNQLYVELASKNFTLIIEGNYEGGGNLKAPKVGIMNRDITESLNSEVHIKLFDKNKKLLYADKSFNSGIEVCGRISELFN